MITIGRPFGGDLLGAKAGGSGCVLCWCQGMWCDVISISSISSISFRTMITGTPGSIPVGPAKPFKTCKSRRTRGLGHFHRTAISFRTRSLDRELMIGSLAAGSVIAISRGIANRCLIIMVDHHRRHHRGSGFIKNFIQPTSPFHPFHGRSSSAPGASL